MIKSYKFPNGNKIPKVKKPEAIKKLIQKSPLHNKLWSGRLCQKTTQENGSCFHDYQLEKKLQEKSPKKGWTHKLEEPKLETLKPHATVVYVFPAAISDFFSTG